METVHYSSAAIAINFSFVSEIIYWLVKNVGQVST